jgi:hypothetical protein
MDQMIRDRDPVMMEIPNFLGDHRGHLITLWLWAESRINSGVIPIGVEILHAIHRETPDSPFLSCMYHRFSDGKQEGTLKLLSKISKDKNTYGWGSSRWQIHHVLTLKCLTGF